MNPILSSSISGIVPSIFMLSKKRVLSSLSPSSFPGTTEAVMQRRGNFFEGIY